MSTIRLASRYAKSLLDLSLEQGKLEEVYADMQYVNEVCKVSREFDLMLKSPLIYADKKLKMIEAVLTGKLTNLTMLFIKNVVKKGREKFLKDMTFAFIHQYYAHKQITPVTLKTAVEMDQNKISELLEKVKKEAGLVNIELTTEVDESLIGGFVLQYEDKRYDASVANSIDELKKDVLDTSYIKKY